VEERAERAGVALALPVGLLFLPAFFCLGVLPVVLGLAARLGPLF
jgi:pilus assembly protein TadC